ncbi:Thiosulfate sulfurtransferase GlpE [invertebrate metagenome]|uniref:Thiosulfate sulfurtransferase GlpE n=1 Tax=invertebrate metagenome TaxID=1711999 RepID=A0A2H9T5B0_9ZZZZ
MEQYIEFITNHPVLTGTLALLVILFIVLEKRKGGQGITTAQMTQLINNEGAVVLDIREKTEFGKGHVIGAINIPSSKIKSRLSELDKYRDKPVIVVDAMGQHGGSAGKQLKEAGLTRVMKLTGGIGTWQADGLPLVKKG